MLWNRKQNSWLDNRGRYLGSLFVWSEASSSMFIEICKITNHEVRAFMKLPTLTPFTRRCPRSSGQIQFALYHHHYRHCNCSWHQADCKDLILGIPGQMGHSSWLLHCACHSEHFLLTTISIRKLLTFKFELPAGLLHCIPCWRRRWRGTAPS